MLGAQPLGLELGERVSRGSIDGWCVAKSIVVATFEWSNHTPVARMRPFRERTSQPAGRCKVEIRVLSKLTNESVELVVHRFRLRAGDLDVNVADKTTISKPGDKVRQQGLFERDMWQVRTVVKGVLVDVSLQGFVTDTRKRICIDTRTANGTKTSVK